MANKNSLTAQYDSLPLIVRILIQIFLGAIVGAIYRIIRFTETKNTITLVAAIVALFTVFIAWIVDLVTLIINGKYTVFVD